MSEQAIKQEKKITIPIIIGFVVFVVLVAAYWYWKQGGANQKKTVVEPPASATIKNPDLGSELIEKAQNPIKDQLPATVAPVPNPLEGVYKNPFQ